MIANRVCSLRLGNLPECRWSYLISGSEHAWAIRPPVFEIDRQLVPAVLTDVRAIGEPKLMANGAREWRFEGVFAACPGLRMELVFRLAEDDPVVRFRYILKSDVERRLTKRNGDGGMAYLAMDAKGLTQVKEVRFSDFNEQVHSYWLTEQPLDDRHFLNGWQASGPMILGQRDGEAVLLAYEHGARYPDAFLEYHLTPQREISLHALKGNHADGHIIGPDQPFETIWFQFAGVAGDEDDLACAYRDFVLHHQCQAVETRKPYIYYNTFGFQERDKYRRGKGYFDVMNLEHVLKEIEVAHRLGIEVFVLDSGWYDRLGDWGVNMGRFPDGLGTIKARLEAHGMKLGLWFAPNMASLSSRVIREYPEYAASMHGKAEPFDVTFEDDRAHWMCMVSDFRDVFAEELIRLVKETGVTYFKWDMLDQRGCDAPHHHHGGPDASPQERADCFGFGFPLSLAYIAQRVAAACPEAIIDYDVTESRRAFGLGFLSAGKYFLLNNGPYYKNYNVPVPAEQNPNIFTRPGLSRGWICRAPLAFDKWIPSVLLLTHYLPDEPESSQLVNLGSLILGQNGIWGDLLGLSEESVTRLSHWLGVYKQVRDDITRSTMIREGTPGCSPEIHEKICSKTGRGVVVAFASTAGRYDYITHHPVSADASATSGVSIERDVKRRARLKFDFADSGVQFAFFGTK